MNETPQASGSDMVLRGMMLLALMLIVVVGGYAIFFRRATPAVPAPAAEPQHLAVMLVQPVAEFPGTLSWGTLYALADELPSGRGWQIRFQAARGLAHAGSKDVPWDIYAEMLDEHRMFCNFRTKLDNGQMVVQEAAARQIIMGALKDLAIARAKQPTMSMPGSVRAAVDVLAQSTIAELKAEAEKISR